jgi:hypothetical protein
LEIKEGNIKLHFHTISDKGVLTDLWIEGKGVADTTSGVIEGAVVGNEPYRATLMRKQQDIFLMKGAWTRMISQLSEKGEEAIKRRNPYP